jgi:hypothetical protein
MTSWSVQACDATVYPKFGSWHRQGTKNAKRNIVLEVTIAPGKAGGFPVFG